MPQIIPPPPEPIVRKRSYFIRVFVAVVNVFVALFWAVVTLIGVMFLLYCALIAFAHIFVWLIVWTNGEQPSWVQHFLM